MVLRVNVSEDVSTARIVVPVVKPAPTTVLPTPIELSADASEESTTIKLDPEVAVACAVVTSPAMKKVGLREGISDGKSVG